MGAVSSICTMSPTLAVLASSWAWYFLERRTVFFMIGCVKRRSTLTTTVLSFLSETTVPCKIRLGIWSSLLRDRGFLGEHGLDASDLATDLAHLRGVFQLLSSALETQIELFFLQIDELIVEFVDRLCPNVARLCHRYTSLICNAADEPRLDRQLHGRKTQSFTRNFFT